MAADARRRAGLPRGGRRPAPSGAGSRTDHGDQPPHAGRRAPGRRNDGVRAEPMRHLLVVEDNPDDIYFLTETFESLLPDVALKIAKHGDEAIAYLSGKGLYANRREYPLPSEVILD